ncbi:hypothetical protein EIP91_001891 [Steccherinum ochraceum]|uniref:Carbonic anhydrase n=1 Tax=Steccherinum ochraceum TaxID=92696 RepID=A0A4R0RJG6_9APHY|nr:hypothetical protein EIP91_001891 [Steccherinum ochraceum]
MTLLISHLAHLFFLSLCIVTNANGNRAYSAKFGRRDVTIITDPVLAGLLDQNEAWAQNMDKTRPGFFNESAKAQNPKVLWLGCSDSRVPESVITNSLPGDIFVQRNIANQIPSGDPDALAVIAYAVDVDHLQVDRIVVAGHTHSPFLLFQTDPALNNWLSDLYALAVKLIDSGSSDGSDTDAELSELTIENVKMQVQNVAELDVVKEAWKEGRDLRVVGWLHQLESGRLKDLGICAGPLGEVGCGL